MRKAMNSGDKFELSEWVFIRDEKKRFGSRMSLCRCVCGTEKVIQFSKAKSGRWQTCGCIYPTNGMPQWKKEIRGVWSLMIARCNDSENQSYQNYGARGITVCREWLDSFDRFCEDMGPRPSPKHSIDRIDNDAGYSKDNCRWTTAEIQASNKRTNTLITANGETKTISEWARLLGCTVSVICSRIKNGWKKELAVTIPVRPHKGRGKTKYYHEAPAKKEAA